MDGNYPFSIFYFTYSVFENAGKKLKNNEDNHSFKLLLRSVLLNTIYKRHIGTSITFTTRQIFNLIKDVEFGNRFSGFMQLSKNMAFPEEEEKIRGDKDLRLLQFATYKNGEVEGRIKVVCEDENTKRYFERKASEEDYPIEVVNSEDAFSEILEIEKKLQEKFRNI